MSKKLNKHGYAESLKYMHILKEVTKIETKRKKPGIIPSFISI